MKKKTLWREQLRSLGKSRGRFLSIMALLFLGSFALVGLKVSGPLLQENMDRFQRDLNVMDLTVLADYGLSEKDRRELDGWKDIADIEYGYLTDVVKKDTNTALRIFSAGERISAYMVTEGRLPQTENEIAVADFLDEAYDVGRTLEVTEKDEEHQILRHHRFTVTGRVNSGELVSKDFLGSSSAGSGSLSGYAVVTEGAFDSKYAVIARLRLHELTNISAFSTAYEEKVEKHRLRLEDELADNAGQRRNELERDAGEELDRHFEEEKNKALQEAYVKAEAEANKRVDEEAAAAEKKSEEQLAAALAKLADSGLPAEFIEMQKQTMLAEAESRKTAAKEKIREVRQTAIRKAKEEARKKVDEGAKKPDLPVIPKPAYSVYTRRTIPGGEGFLSVAVNTEGTTRVGDLFPVVLYLVAALVTMTTMTRFVNEERINAGVLAALGFSKGDIIRKFTRYGLAAGLTGSVIGIVAGTFFLPLMIRDTLLAGAGLPSLRMHLFPTVSVTALVCAWICSVLPAWVIARRELHEVPAALLLPKPPMHGARIFLERVKPIWSRMTFTAKVTARNLFRYKQRMLMTLFGVGGAVALLFAGLGIAASVEAVSRGQFGDILHYDLLVQEKQPVTETNDEKREAAEKLNHLLADRAVTAALPIYSEQLTKKIPSVIDAQKINLLVTGNKNLEPMISLFSGDKKWEELPQSGVLLSQKLADILKVREGDQIKFRRSDGTDWSLPVAGVVRMYAGHYALMSRSAYEAVFNEDWKPNAHLLTSQGTDEDSVRSLAARFMELRAVKTVVQNTGIKKQIATVSASLHRVMIILVVVSILLAAVILYNLTAINVAERIRELSTIKVLGFYDGEVTRYIYRETMILSSIGIGLGWLGGHILHSFILRMVAPDHILFPTEVALSVYLIPVGIIGLILAAMGLMVHALLKRVDMLEALKSVD